MKKFIVLFRDLELDVYADTREEARRLALAGFISHLENELEVIEMKVRTERCDICPGLFNAKDLGRLRANTKINYMI